MKRFYKMVSVVADTAGDGYQVQLDTRPVKTPGRNELRTQAPALAEAIAQEWRSQETELLPATMPLTRLACGAIDRIEGRPEQVIDEIAAYAETDLLCYRADHPPALIKRQTDLWQPVLDWMAARFNAAFSVTAGVIPVSQSPETLDAVRSAVAAHDSMTLSALHAVTHASGSVVLGLALVEKRLSADDVVAASQLDEQFQVEQWGEDSEAAERRRDLAQVIGDSARFLSLLHGRDDSR